MRRYRLSRFGVYGLDWAYEGDPILCHETLIQFWDFPDDLTLIDLCVSRKPVKGAMRAIFRNQGVYIDKLHYSVFPDLMTLAFRDGFRAMWNTEAFPVWWWIEYEC